MVSRQSDLESCHHSVSHGDTKHNNSFTLFYIVLFQSFGRVSLVVVLQIISVSLMLV